MVHQHADTLGEAGAEEIWQEASQAELTPREAWIYENFSFLQQHVIPTQGRQAKVIKCGCYICYVRF